MPAAPARWTALGPLRRGLTLRLGLVLLVALAALSGAVIVVAERAERAAAGREVDAAVASLDQQFRAVQGNWLSQADVLRAQLDFSRLLDQPDAEQRNALLSSYFATLGGEGLFTHALLATAEEGRVLWRYRTRSQGDLAPPPGGVSLGWVFSERDGTLYRAIGQRVLVAGKAAWLWLFVPLDTGLLAANTPLDVAAELQWQGRVLLRYPPAPSEAGRLAAQADPADHPARTLAWAGATDGPRLVIRRYAAQVIHVPQALAIAALAGAVVAVLGWGVLARWLQQHARRLGALQSAAQGFQKTRQMDAGVRTALDAAAAGASGELQDLAADMRAMMQAVEDAQAELTDLNAHLEARIEQRTHELALARDAALAGTRAKEQFLANMSHELRTPLSGMLGSLEMIDEHSLSAPQAELLGIARSSGQALVGIINEVLDLSKLEAGRMELVPVPFRPAELLGEVVSLFRAGALRKSLDLHGECAGIDPALAVMGDAARLRQVLLNLTANAIKFTQQGGVTLRLEGSLGPAADARLHFEVVDTGPGVAPADQRRIFEAFEQASAAGARAPAAGGTGLGLAISDRLVAAMGGRLSVNSLLGEGSRFQFEITLPLAHPDAPLAAAPAPAPAPAAQPHAALQGTVLLVDDNLVNRIIATQMLQRLGLQVIECEDGRAALERLDTSAVDAVLMDCQMPVMDGYEATRRIRAGAGRAIADPARLPIIALTANAMPGDAQRCRDAGMDDYLAKPFNLAQLRAVLSAWLPAAAIADR